MKMRLYTILALTLLAPLVVLAEGKTATVHGVVTDSEGEAVAGAGVFHPHCGTKTDTNGNFSFQIPTNTVMRFPARPPSINIMPPGKTFFLSKELDLRRVGAGLPIDLGRIVIPPSDRKTVVKGKVIGDADVFPQSIQMRDETRGITAILVPRPHGDRKGEFEGTGFPAGEYILTNVPNPKEPNQAIPRTALPFRQRIKVPSGETVSVTIEVKPKDRKLDNNRVEATK
jgi:hypothetical protein